MRRLIYLALAILLLASPAMAQEAYCVNDSDDMLVSYRANLADVPCPTGETAVTMAEVREHYAGPIYQGGTWDGTTYSLPAHLQPPAAGTRDAAVAAARLLRTTFGRWRDELAAGGARFYFPIQSVEWLHNALLYAEHGAAMILTAPATSYTYAERVKIAEDITAGPAQSNGGDMVTMLEVVQAGQAGDGDYWDVPPAGPVSWYDVETGALVALGAIGESLDDAPNPLAAAPTLEAVRHGAWINAIP